MSEGWPCRACQRRREIRVMDCSLSPERTFSMDQHLDPAAQRAAHHPFFVTYRLALSAGARHQRCPTCCRCCPARRETSPGYGHVVCLWLSVFRRISGGSLKCVQACPDAPGENPLLAAILSALLSHARRGLKGALNIRTTDPLRLDRLDGPVKQAGLAVQSEDLGVIFRLEGFA